MINRKTQIPKMQLRADFQPSTIDEKNKSVEVVWSTGAPVKRCPFFSDPFFETLSLDPKNVRLERLNSGAAPFLAVHDQYSLDSVLGVVQKAWLQNSEGRALVRFSDREDVQSIFNDVKNGILKNISVGYAVYKYERQPQGDNESIPTYLATDWEPMEISLVPVGADSGAGLRAKENEINECIFINEIEKTLTEVRKMEKETKVENQIDKPTPENQVRAETPPNLEKLKSEAIDVERKRVSEILKSTRTAKLEEDFAHKLIETGVTVEKARELIIDEWAKKEEAVQTRSQVKVEVGGDQTREARMEGAEQFLLHRFKPQEFKLSEKGMEFRGMSLMEIARVFCEASGVRTRGLTKMELSSRALHSTSDFPNVLANIANKTLRQAYESAPKTYVPIVREADLPDFKQVSRVSLGGAPALELVGEDGEVKRGTIGEGAEKYQLASYAKIVGITRQVIINDDLGAFTRLPELFGRAAADLESDLVWAILTANAALSDAIALFHASHNNLGTAGFISDTTLTEARAKMRLQQDPNGKVLNLLPVTLIVPAALETTARKFLAQEIRPTKAADANPFSGQFDNLIVEPRLDANSSTAWYIAAATGQIDIVELGYLSGQRGVYMETRNGFDVDGVEVKARLDVAAKAIDYRGIFKNVGA
ncbi:MAG: Mu-like prophage major head subunit gpT family protein [Oligoflexia bacterium]|nr:Mu-like prophage major head subunit gpT family protein [Oligoflexia bacterium]